MNDNELGTTAAREAEALENFDGGFDANPLTGDNVLTANATVDLDGTLREVSVGYNTDGGRVTVDLLAGTLTVAAGFDSHKTHVADDAEAVRQARDMWVARFDGVEVDA